jgi:enamine deaminase RidA (YjgF/YER057c/UK114 family)
MVRPTLSLLVVATIAALCASPIALASQASGAAPIQPPGNAAPAPATTSPDLHQQAMDFTGGQKIINCIDGLERILPADYYGCRALYHLQREHWSSYRESLRDAAYWANKNAQYLLGIAFFNGDVGDIPVNRPLGLAWLALAAERKNPDYVTAYAGAVARSSPAEKQQASKIYQKLKKDYSDKVAGTRAVQRFNHEIQPMQDAAQSGGTAYISGFGPFPEQASQVVKRLHDQAEQDFTGLMGTVTVGAIEPDAHSMQIRPQAAK